MKNFTEVINGCLANHHKYQQILYEQYHSYAFKIVFRYIFRHDKAEDAVNDGFVKLLNNIDKFEVRNHIDVEKLFMAWLKQIMIHTAIDGLRREKKEEAEPLDENSFCVPEQSANAHEILFYNDLIKEVKELPVPYRLVFNLHVIDGYSHAEIASMLNLPVATSRSHLLRARTLLQKKIVYKEIYKHAEYRQ